MLVLSHCHIQLKLMSQGHQTDLYKAVKVTCNVSKSSTFCVCYSQDSDLTMQGTGILPLALRQMQTWTSGYGTGFRSQHMSTSLGYPNIAKASTFSIGQGTATQLASSTCCFVALLWCTVTMAGTSSITPCCSMESIT